MLFEDYSNLQAYRDDLRLYHRVSLAMYNFYDEHGSDFSMLSVRKQVGVLLNFDSLMNNENNSIFYQS
jgi:hypothetical protein